MKRFTRFVWSIGCAAAVLVGHGPTARADLAAEVHAVLQEKLLHKTTTGIEVYRLGKTESDVKEVFNLSAQTPLTPASNLKVATTSAALDQFGQDFKFRTILLMHDGDVIMVGDGDPTFGDAEYLKKAGWKTTTVFVNWAEQLKKLNVAQVKDVIVDDSVFDEDFSNSHWPAGQYAARFEAEVGGINLNANCIDFTVTPGAPGQRVGFSTDPRTSYVSVRNNCVTGNLNRVRLNRDVDSNQITLAGETPGRRNALVSITIHDPPMYAGTVLAETLAANGIKITGAVKRDRSIRAAYEKIAKPAGNWQVIAIHETPLAAVLARCNKDSVNVYAESLCKRLGHETAHAAGTWPNGTAAVGAFLRKAGVAQTEFKLDDGSGLSRADLISPHALARVLIYDHYSKNHDFFFNSLSIAGVDGTLDNRFAERGLRDLRRRVIGKSGFIEGVSTVSGYLHAKDDQWYAFSIMMNGIPRLSNSQVKVLQEKIIRALDNNTASASARG
ncbi:MAG TPA: D-alanyl-D-alanine carboxypeptidase/D-alanyl-D-alanine-endopeptidase [Tepidisphaeraceae bacterium]|nr:D-alanyl-D-alanine carboxypeptidase/D-alanyl-D-alanine-endopeptidase [Tepidisphaeraceae bacterium]